MSKGKQKPKDTTRGGLKVDPPTRGEFFGGLEKVSRPEPEDQKEPDQTTDGQ